MACILIVDDALIARQIAAFILCQADHRVLQACQGQEALDQLQAGPVDLIVSDIDATAMAGLLLLQWLRAHPEWRRLPVIMLAERGDEMARRRARTAGADAVLTKPVISWQLKSVVAQLLPEKSVPNLQ